MEEQSQPQPQEKITVIQKQGQEIKAQVKMQPLVNKQQEKTADVIQKQKQEICHPSVPKPLTNPPNPPPNPPSKIASKAKPKTIK